MNGGRGCVCVCVCVCGVCWGSNLAQKISTIISEPKFEPHPPNRNFLALPLLLVSTTELQVTRGNLGHNRVIRCKCPGLSCSKHG